MDKKRSKKIVNKIDLVDQHFEEQNTILKKEFGYMKKSIFDLPKDISIEISTTKSNVLEFYKNDKIILKTKFNFHGIIDEKGNFHWSNTLHGVDKRISMKTSKLRDKNKDLFTDSNDPDTILYYHLINNNQFNIGLDPKNIKKLNKLLMFISDDYYFINPIIPSGNIQLITLSKFNDKLFIEKFL